MNTRIQELADQAKSQVPKGILAPDLWIEQYNQKFAKLIIEECCDLIVGHEYDLVPGYKQRMTAFAEVCLIKEHFGV